jgi:hypothetical protein
LRAERSNPLLLHCCRMDCFASLAKMGWTAPDGIDVPDW